MLRFLNERGGSARRREVFEHLSQALTFDDWASEKTASGQARWEGLLDIYSIGASRSGWIRKRDGTWYLTEEGLKIIDLDPVALATTLDEEYREWARNRHETKSPHQQSTNGEDLVEADTDIESEILVDDVQGRAREALARRVSAMNPYEFQELVAALLRAMGYSTPFVAPRGRDGGLDIIAYSDPLGAATPRIKVQVKHRQSSASVQEIRELMGLLHRGEEVGVFVSTGGFTSDAQATARTSQVHMELIDLERFLDLWEQHYEKMNDEDRALLPLVRVYLPAPE
ncbi:MAG: hypothetical protein KatS3mg015_2705 [Fimbriimonadales bacterium]|nr:MAG: hypothetical protein KatS3mg015_2705 [Fimbriimonadales bacterium]